ncbi:MAG: hypothetical protein K6C13_01520 [Oscillospiraceae bacterium]|nr:hypothetical protein [Oscillospiraceae bacterium]
MNTFVLLQLAAAVSACLGFLSGATKYLRPHKPLYASMIVLGTACIMLGHGYTFMRMITGLPVRGIFHVGCLGTVGAFAFFFSSNYGQIDSLVDDGSNSFMKYRALAFLSVILTAGLYILILLSPASNAEKFTDGIVTLSVAAAGYFHLKHIIIPDIDYGVVKCLRLFNVLALIYAVMCMAEMLISAYGRNDLLPAVVIIRCILSVLFVPVMDKGVRKWST